MFSANTRERSTPLLPALLGGGAKRKRSTKVVRGSGLDNSGGGGKSLTSGPNAFFRASKRIAWKRWGSNISCRVQPSTTTLPLIDQFSQTDQAVLPALRGAHHRLTKKSRFSVRSGEA